MDAGNTNIGVVGADGASHKERFIVDLVPGGTNIVSLKKLRREAGEAVSDDSLDENENQGEKYIFVRLPRKKSSGSHAIRNKVQLNTGRVEHSKSKNQSKKRRKEITDHVGEEEDFQADAKARKRGKKLSDTAAENGLSVQQNLKSKSLECNLHNNGCQGYFQKRLKSSGGVLIIGKHFQSSSKFNPGKSISFTSAADRELHSRSSMRTSIKQQSEIGRIELPCQSLPYSGHAPGTASVNLTGTPKIRNEMLHLSILQLKMLVEHSKTPLSDVQGADSSLPDYIEIHLSLELKEKLRKIARWTELNKGKICEELIDRLMDILGKYIERTNLKKILREMILEDLYASQADCKKFKQIEMEFVELIRLQAPSFKVKVPAPGLTKSTYSIGDHLDDKLCDLYDTFIQGLDEDIGPSVVRRLFAKLADLWPKGTMDMHEIREAICRAKERRMVPTRK